MTISLPGAVRLRPHGKDRFIDVGGTVASAPAFNPLTLSPTAWFKADSISGVTTDGTAISSWTDRSGNNNHALQATGSKQPLYKTNIQNSLPAVLFDGVDDWLLTQIFSGALTQPTTVMIVAAMNNPAAGGYYFDGAGSANRHAFGDGLGTGGHHEIYAGSGVIGAVQGRPSGTNLWTLVFNGASSSMRKNAAAFASGATNIGAHTLTGLALGANNNGTVLLSGYLHEMVLVNRLLTGTEQTNVETYLKAKWGTP